MVLTHLPCCQVLREPQPHFDVIKRHYPHFIHRRARNGCPVWIELPGRIDLPAIRSAGVSPEALQRHYVFVTEYMWGVLEPDFENGQAVTVLDVQGLGMRDLAGEALGFVKVGFRSPCVAFGREQFLFCRLQVGWYSGCSSRWRCVLSSVGSCFCAFCLRDHQYTCGVRFFSYDAFL